ncbi:MAG: MarR family transcriptional regulator [Roseibium sp.]|uniref:MarR family winged helix-turn-helix transcriptional regulator n=1 Tax=Roseibium sp. TaxID=1936156 RepID=UPI003D9C1DD7
MTGQSETLSKARLRVWLKLLKASNGIEAEIRRRLRDGHNTTLPRFDVMSALARFPEGLKMSELSTFLRVSNGNVTGIVDKLTEEGLAQRVAVPGDKRAQVARLTKKGEAEFESLANRHESWINSMLDGLTNEDLETLSDKLERVLAQSSEQERADA